MKNKYLDCPNPNTINYSIITLSILTKFICDDECLTGVNRYIKISIKGNSDDYDQFLIQNSYFVE
jgi:hypothetical protein